MFTSFEFDISSGFHMGFEDKISDCGLDEEREKNENEPTLESQIKIKRINS